MKYILVQTDKAANNVVVVGRLCYIDTLKRGLIDTNSYRLHNSLSEKVVVVGHGNNTTLKCGVKF